MGVVIPEPIDGRALAWSFIPGLGHLKTGRRRWGRILLPTWLGFLALALLSIGTWWLQFMLAGLVAVHALAVVTLFAANLAFERFFMRAAFGMVVFLTFHFLVYRPCFSLCSQFLVIVPIAHSPGGTVVLDGDALLSEGPWLRPASFTRGDVVVYRLTNFSANGIFVRAGYGVNRVVGEPGDRVTHKDALLLVNGRPPQEGYGPLGRIRNLGDLDVVLAPREYAVFTTVELGGANAHRPQLWRSPTLARHLSIVRYDDIVGRVIVRLRPLVRFGRVG